MVCGKCKTENPGGLKFCNECGAPFKTPCASCGFENAPAAKFCGQCGAALGAPPAENSARKSGEARIRVPDEPAPENPEGERKTVTALFADIKSSMELIEDIDPEEARAVVDPALKLMIEAVNRYGGHVVQSTGDGIFALFGAPLAHEDHPQRALYAAIRMQNEMQRYSAKLREAGHPPVEARVGVNSGEVVIRSIATAEGHTEYTPIGHSTSLAARMQMLAPSGSIAATEHVKNLCEGYFLFKLLGPTAVKGVTGPLNVYEVTGVGPLRTHFQLSARRGLTRFVGRDPEMEAIARAAQLAKSGHGQIVGVVAEPGVGKSRLFHEFKVRNQSGWMVLAAYSVSHGKASAYLPVIELLQSYVDSKPEDDSRKRREKVTGRLLALDRTLEDALPYLFGLLGIVESDDPLAQMDAQIRRRRTLDAIKRILLRESVNQPLMVIFEDLHWIDDETQALLNLLAESIGDSPILLALNYRPEYRHDWGTRASFTQIRLEPLKREFADEMLRAMLGDDPSVVPLRRLVIEKSDATPFFIEEMVQTLFEEGVLTRNGAVRATKPVTDIHLPATVNAVLASRIDRLSPQEKELLQTLAVIGDEFALKLVREVVKTPSDDLDSMLSRLQDGEFIYEQPTADDIEYRFKHALTHEVAYNSVLVERRKLLHGRVAEGAERLFSNRIEDHLGELARHYSRSGNTSKAVEYMRRAGEQAGAHAAHAQAIEHFTAALTVLAGMPAGSDRIRAELALQIDLGRSFGAARGPAAWQVESAYARARELAMQVGDDVQLFDVTEALIFYYNFAGELRAARELRSELLERAARLNDPVTTARANNALGHMEFLLGEWAAAREHWEATIDARPDARSVPFLQFGPWHTREFLCWALWILGYPDQARSTARQEVRTAREAAQPHPLTYAMLAACEVYLWCGDVPAAAEHSAAMVKIAEEYGFSFQLGRATLQRGAVLASQGKVEQGITEIRRGAAQIAATGAQVRSYQHAHLAEALWKTRAVAEAFTAVAAGLSAVKQTGERMGEAELHRIRGELLWAAEGDSAGAVREAEACLVKAIEVARSRAGKSLELRATMSLARLLRDTGRRDEARAMLSEIYNWFSEGFDTADLKDAKALLDELAH